MPQRQAVKIRVKGMTCQGCVNAVTRVVRRIDADAAVQIELSSGEVLAETAAKPEAIIAAINGAGYEASAA